MEGLEAEITEWRTLLGEGALVEGTDLDELEGHLRDQVDDLMAAGLAEDEAFLVAVKRIGTRDELSREFAREHSGRLWRQLVISTSSEPDASDGGWQMSLLFAITAAATVLAVLVVSGYPEEEPSWLLRNAGLVVLPFLAGFFALRRRLSTRQTLVSLTPFLIAGIVINLYPYGEASSSELLVAVHLPVLFWFLCAYPYMGGELRSHERRMHFVRFTGEWFIYYVLIALGGGVLLGLTAVILEPTGADVERIIEWVLPAGATGAVIIAAWLVESKQRVVENMAPVLTMVFTPLFALMLTSAVVVYAATGFGDGFDRELLGVFDALLVVVLGLVLYGISAREQSTSPRWMDRIQLVAVVMALVLDAMVLATMIDRVNELGFTPNRTAALGLNLLLLVNLGWSAWLSARFLAGRSSFHHLEHWQTSYLPAFALWAAVVVAVLPSLFAFV